MSKLEELHAITYSHSEYLHEKVMDANDVHSAMVQLEKLDTKVYAPGQTGILVNIELVEKINELKLSTIRSEARMDFECSKLLWGALKYDNDIDIKIQFSDRRIWLDLTLNYLQSYVLERWRKSPDISSRLFINGALTGGKLIRQIISRLWWHAYLTHDVENDDNWHLLDTLCSNSDVLLAITDRPKISHSKLILMRLLKYLKKEENKEVLKGEKIKQFTKWVIAYSGIMELTLMEESDFNNLMNHIKKKINV